MRKTDRSRAAFQEALSYLPGGVNSPVRAFGAVGGSPLFIARAAGATIEDIDGNRYVDFVNSWGPLILGHAHPRVVEALQEAVRKGTSFGAPTETETALAKRIVGAMPSIERVRFVNSGTEAVMTALRLARGYTGRSAIVKFAGCYHGHSDSLLVQAGSGVLTFGCPDSPGVPEALARETIVLPYNDVGAVETVMAHQGDRIACIIVEPIAGNMGVVPPRAGFLEGLRLITERHGALLIFDEVITGFRVGWRGAQGRFGVEPDITCLGKVIGGGLPVGAVGGREEIMRMLAPEGPVYQAGTLSGNPLAMSAGLATLNEVAREGFFDALDAKGELCVTMIQEAAACAGASVCVQGVGSMLTVFFQAGPVENLEQARRSDLARFRLFHQCLLEEGIYWPPSQFEAAFVSEAHTDRDLRAAAEAMTKAFERAQRAS